nr:MAG TPA: hypothetical protein [Caudoviricetes sp.]DAY27661.1 MAG TPA: hypothetical protein [Caudoviricetes sp.]
MKWGLTCIYNLFFRFSSVSQASSTWRFFSQDLQ